jgi:hypothetical protein
VVGLIADRFDLLQAIARPDDQSSNECQYERYGPLPAAVVERLAALLRA